ncbi:MAG: superoxide dismutase [Candidatus Micrarchaeota archaeon]|nr:MAG: superoxide dismutase [Candidatus Micrarchaeota archaeon]
MAEVDKSLFKRYELPQLPYSLDALEPYISRDILDVHYNGHHKGYVTAVNKLIDRYESILKGDVTSYDIQGIVRGIVFNLNGHKLHALYWKNMAPADKNRGGPGGVLADKINKQFKSLDNFKKILLETANSLPGTGWTAVTYDSETDNLNIITIENHFMNHIAELPIVIIVDEFEHAYYLQYKNKRADYVDAWWKLINWDDAEERLRKAINRA